MADKFDETTQVRLGRSDCRPFENRSTERASQLSGARTSPGSSQFIHSQFHKHMLGQVKFSVHFATDRGSDVLQDV
jgi:hypothetical protein